MREMISSSLLDACSDEELREVNALVDKILKHRDDERKSEAMERARALLASAGLKLEDLVKAKKKPARALLYRGGRMYQHPTDKTLVWHARGQKPNWLRDLEAAGGTAVELPASDNVVKATVNDNVIPAVKRMA